MDFWRSAMTIHYANSTKSNPSSAILRSPIAW